MEIQGEATAEYEAIPPCGLRPLPMPAVTLRSNRTVKVAVRPAVRSPSLERSELSSSSPSPSHSAHLFPPVQFGSPRKTCTHVPPAQYGGLRALHRW